MSESKHPLEGPKFEYTQYRRWIAEEHQIIGNRVGWLVSSNVFLMAPFAIAQNENNTAEYLETYIPMLGGSIAFFALISIHISVQTIKIFVEKENSFFKSNENFKVFDPQRHKYAHGASLIYPLAVPILLITFWILCFLKIHTF